MHTLLNAATLPELFTARVQATPKAVAYQYFDKAWQSLSWHGMALQVARLQGELQPYQLKVGDRVAIKLPNGPLWIIAEQALLGLGLVVVPLYVQDHRENVAYQLQDSGCRLMITDDAPQLAQPDAAPAPDTEKYPCEVHLFTSLAVFKQPNDSSRSGTSEVKPHTLPLTQPVSIDAQALASIVYTSGTTGAAKGVMLSHANILSNAAAGLQCVHVDSSDRFVSFLPLSHMLERSAGYYLPMMAGARVAYVPNIEALTQALLDIKPTLLVSVPRIFERIQLKIQEKMSASWFSRHLLSGALAGAEIFTQETSPEASFSGWKKSLYAALNRLVTAKIQAKFGGHLRHAICGGAPLDDNVARFFIGLGVDILQGYGLTECSPIVSVNRPQRNQIGSVGEALPNVRLRIGDNSELLIHSPGNMQGYWQRPEASAEVLDAQGWLHSGDQARLNHGMVWITGRIKDIIVLSTGEKIAPADMEQALLNDGLFKQTLVMGEAQPHLTLLAVIEPSVWQRRYGTLPDVDKQGIYRVSEEKRQAMLDLVQTLTHHMPAYAKIHRIILLKDDWSIDNGLMTVTLKLRRQRIIERYAGTPFLSRDEALRGDTSSFLSQPYA